MKCPKCGGNIPAGATNCGTCGAKITMGKRCPSCQSLISAEAVICPKCGRQLGPIIAPPTAQKKKLHPALIVVIALFGVLILGSVMTAIFGDTDTRPSSSTVSEKGDKETSKASNVSSEKPVAKMEPDTSFDTSEYMKIDADVLFEYGVYLGKQKVVTVVTVEDVSASSGAIKARTSNNDSFFFSFICNFRDKSIAESIEEGSTLTIAGAVQPKNDVIPELSTETITLDDCSLIGLGEIAEELKEGVTEQRQICETAKDKSEAEVSSQTQVTRDDYISQCEAVDYSDVERNPSSYEGKKITFSGTVVQVSEGWFDSVTLRVEDNGNTWLVSYSRDEGESRILEDDYITCYGECTGVTSYTTVLGSSVTIPSMDLEYYD